MAYFHLRLVAPRSTFPGDASPAESAAMQEHFAYWTEQARQGIAIAVGPVLDPEGVYGMAVIDARDGSSAQALADADPVIVAGLGFHYRVASIPSLIVGAARGA